MTTNLAFKNSDEGLLKPGVKSFPNRFYSDFISRTFSRECLDRLGEMAGKCNLGFVSVQIAKYYDLAEGYGSELGFRFLSELETEGRNRFHKCFPECEIISVEHTDINSDIICFQIPDEQLFLLGNYVGSGSTFYFTAKFPLDEPTVAAEAIRFDNVRVLLADSKQTSRENLGLPLTHWGHGRERRGMPGSGS